MERIASFNINHLELSRAFMFTADRKETVPSPHLTCA